MKYSDNKDKIICNGNTTVVYGVGKPNDQFVKKFFREIEAINWEQGKDLEISNSFEVKGVATCDNEDTYDKSTGIKVASRKAELKARRKMWRNLNRVRSRLHKIIFLVDKEQDEIYKRILEISNELSDIRGR